MSENGSKIALTSEEIAEMHTVMDMEDLQTHRVFALLDSHEFLRAEVARLTRERDAARAFVIEARRERDAVTQAGVAIHDRTMKAESRVAELEAALRNAERVILQGDVPYKDETLNELQSLLAAGVLQAQLSMIQKNLLGKTSGSL